MQQSRQEIVAWVGRHVLPHEADVRGWLRRSGVPQADIDDIVQEAYCRLAALSSVAHIVNGRAYFFQTARSVVVERVRKARVVRIEQITEMGAANVVDTGPSPERITAGRNELRQVEALIEGLPDRCRQIFKLRRVHGVPQREVARMLGVTENVVEVQVMRGLRLILRGLTESEAETRLPSAPQDHGQANHRRGNRRPAR